MKEKEIELKTFEIRVTNTNRPNNLQSSILNSQSKKKYAGVDIGLKLKREESACTTKPTYNGKRTKRGLF